MNFGREDRTAVLWILLFPVALALPQLLGWVQADPMLYTGGMASEYTRGFLRGMPFLDPNNGFSTQALGYRAAAEWLGGHVPWWNYYSGVGLPLAGEYQPGVFFPLTFLLLLPKGTVLQQLALQMLCGLGTYGLLRQMGVERRASLAGALLYACNGTLAWHAHAPATAVPFLPWMLWGVERIFASVASNRAGAWRLLAFAMAMGLLCAFPELSYLSGLLALAWAIVRGLQCPAALRGPYAAGIAIGGFVGIAIAAPQLLAFGHYLQHAYIGGHGTEFAYAAFGWPAAAPSLVAPYIYGPPAGYSEGRIVLYTIWGGIGGYVTSALLAAAAYGFWVRRDAIGWLLAGWCAISLGKTFGIEPAVTLLNLVPGVSLAAFYRYAPPSWELALVILAVRGLDHMARGDGRDWRPLAFSAAVAATALVGGVLSAWLMWPMLKDSVGLRNSVFVSLSWAALTTLGVLVLLGLRFAQRARLLVAALLVADAALMAFIPTLTNPRAGSIDRPAIAYLQQHLGLQRFYSLGPIQANYGAYFGIASINHNYLPVSRRWVDWLQANLDRYADQVVFNGNYPRKPGEATQAEELQRNLAAYEWAGVKYVVAAGQDNPLAANPAVKRVFNDGTLSIYELPGTRPYFESEGGHCKLDPRGRAAAAVDCSAPDTLVRRELHFPGWEATVDGERTPINEYRNLFQAVELPAGTSEVRFEYAPPQVGWAWLAALAGLLALFVPTLRRARRWAPRNRSAT